MQFEDYRDRYQTIRLERDDAGVLEMTLHTRGGEALWGSTATSLHGELGECLADIARDPGNKVVVLTGTGSAFCSGLDEQEMPREASFVASWERLFEEGNAMLERLLDVPVPMIAAVNGPAFVHAEVPVLCDIVLAASHAEFADLAHMTNGVVPGDGVHVVWPMLLGPNRGRYFLLTGERIGADEARRLGIVGEVLADEALLPRARELAAQLARLPAKTLRYTRRLLVRELRRRMRQELGEGLALEGLALMQG